MSIISHLISAFRLFWRRSPEHASDWLGRALDGENTEGFRDWAGASPEHVARFLKLSYLSALARESEALKEIDPHQLLAEAHAFRTRQRRRHIGFAALAASIAVLVLFAIRADHRTEPVSPGDAYTADITTRMVRFSDGSTVRLDPGSLMRASFTADRRDVELPIGKGLFTVTHTTSRQPFHVKAPTAEVVVVGTQFTVESTKSQTTVVVISDKVVVRSTRGRTERRTLQAGDAVIVGADGRIRDIVQVSGTRNSEPRVVPSEVAAGSTLQQIAEVFNKLNAKPQLSIEPDVQNQALWATIEVSDPQHVIEVLKAQSNLSVTGSAESDRVIVRRKK